MAMVLGACLSIALSACSTGGVDTDRPAGPAEVQPSAEATPESTTPPAATDPPEFAEDEVAASAWWTLVPQEICDIVEPVVGESLLGLPVVSVHPDEFRNYRSCRFGTESMVKIGWGEQEFTTPNIIGVTTMRRSGVLAHTPAELASAIRDGSDCPAGLDLFREEGIADWEVYGIICGDELGDYFALVYAVQGDRALGVELYRALSLGEFTSQDAVALMSSLIDLV